MNIYKPDFDYSYVIPLCLEMGFDVIRLSISVPQKGDLKGKSMLDYFQEMNELNRFDRRKQIQFPQVD